MTERATTTKAPRWKRLFQNLALSCVTFLLCATALEIVLRLAGYGNLEIYEPDPKVYWKLEPNQDCFTKIGHKPVHINSHGTRGPEFATEKPANTIRILSLGDSRTFGWGLSEAETYSARLQQLLQQKFGGAKKVEVINAGVNAWSYPQMFVYFRDYGLAFKPDVVILGEANLWTQFSENNSPEFVRQMMWRVRLKNFLRRFAIYDYVVEVKLRQFYERERVKFIPVDPNQDPLFKAEQQKDPDALFRSAMENLCRLARTNGVKPVLLFLPTLDDLNSTNTSAVLTEKRAVHTELNVPLVDLTPELLPGGKTLYLDADPVHLNAAGNEIIAAQLFETLTNLASH
jgi:lysophospholipase L1-like esterase